MKKINITDITLKKLSQDREVSLLFREKTAIAYCADALGVNAVELAPIKSVREDTIIYKTIAQNTQNSSVVIPVGFSEEDVNAAWEAVKEAKNPRLQVEVPVSNGIIEAIGKLNMANYVVISHEDGTYSTVTEIGYMELGNQFKTVFLPGEICQDIVALNGRTVLAKYAVTAKPFETKSGYSSAALIFGEDVKCFGLMTDAIGYVVPDNDYTLGDPVNHYHELISLGEGVASALIDGLAELKESIVRV